MGTIRTEVRDQHLNQFPEEEKLLKMFLPCFYITWGRRRRAYNTDLSVYILKPEPFMAEAYGFDQEVMLVYSKYPSIESRSIQAAESFMADEPARGRVEKLTYYFISEAPDAEQWIKNYISVNQEARLIIPLSAIELRKHSGDSWYIRNKTSQLLYGRDLFDYRLPLERDTYFFGRSELAVNLFDSIKRAENRGVFGLRKTGKTSLLFKLERMLKDGNIAEVMYLDCKLPSIRKLRWFQLFEVICKEISKRFALPAPRSCDDISASKEFLRLVGGITRPMLLVFDEIEYISPIALEDKHWRGDFIAFWQTFWACQSRHRTISAMIAGVNPSVVEIDSIDGIQNPLFGIVSYQYLTGLSNEETRSMIRTLGKRMGLKFDYTAVDYIHERYGGHPLLIRMACSTVGHMISEQGVNRPIDINSKMLEEDEQQRDSELMFYCRHVVSELRQFYPDEYEMLELLACGQIHDFIELSGYPEFTKHLSSYGLLGKDQYQRPVIKIPVVGRYVGLELARKEGRKTLFRVTPKKDRSSWLQKRKNSIVADLRLLECAVTKVVSPQIFGINSFPRADDFSKVNVVDTENDFKVFIDVCNKCFVESIENFGKSIGHPHYFWEKIKTAYPGLWHALHRIKIYRHEGAHLMLSKSASADLLLFLEQDLEGKKPSTVQDCYFILQQCVLDGLLTGIQIEMSKLA